MMLRPSVAVFVVGVLASIASVPQTGQEYVLSSSVGANQVVFPIALDPSQRRARVRVTLDATDVEADGPTTPHLGLSLTAQFDDVASAIPARVRAGLLPPDEVDTADLALLTFVSPDETHHLDLAGVFVADVLLVREDEGEGIVSLALTIFGDLNGEGDVEFSGESPVLTVEQLPDDGT